MIRIIMHGCNGKMGQVITGLAEGDESLEIVAGIDARDEGRNRYPVFSKLEDCRVEADCIIDFSVAGAVDGLISYCEERQIPCVLCTTGLSEAQLLRLREASQKVAFLKSANMSLGINLLMKLLKDAAEVLVPAGFDVEIVEKHHNQKLDAPSGTALALADSINDSMDGAFTYVYDRTTRREARDKKELGISAVRGGSIVGEHDTIFAGTDEVITFTHTAYSKAIFGRGALEAARFLAGKGPGLYDMSHVIENR